MRDRHGVAWAYDVNTNTNYNRAAERRHFGDAECNYGMMAVATYLGALLWQLNDDLQQELDIDQASSPSEIDQNDGDQRDDDVDETEKDVDFAPVDDDVLPLPLSPAARATQQLFERINV